MVRRYTRTLSTELLLGIAENLVSFRLASPRFHEQQRCFYNLKSYPKILLQKSDCFWFNLRLSDDDKFDIPI
jgi:hypothetical protein